MTYRQIADALYQVTQPLKGHYLGVAFQGPSWTTATLSSRKDANKWMASMKRQASASFLYDDGTKGLLSQLGNTTLETGITVDPSSVSGPVLPFATDATPQEEYVDPNGVAWVIQHVTDVGDIMRIALDLGWDGASSVTEAWVAWLRPGSPTYNAKGTEHDPNIIGKDHQSVLDQINAWASANHEVATTVEVQKKSDGGGAWLIALLVMAYYVFSDDKRRRR